LFPRWLLAPLIFGQHSAIVEFLVHYYCRHSRKILDLGSRRSPYTQSLPGLVVGVDLPSPDGARLGFNVANLKQFINRNNLAVFGRGEELPFKTETFDSVLMIEVIEHIEKDRKALKEIFAVLKPGGILVQSTPNGKTFPVPAKHHRRHYKPEELRSLMEEFFNFKLFWCLFPKGWLWRESVKSVKNMIQEKDIISIIRHVAVVWFYWIITVWWFFNGKTTDTTTLFVVAEKKTE
jgi:ubiquinone/menaquinone biosynthesis C-methylase UbiE